MGGERTGGQREDHGDGTAQGRPRGCRTAVKGHRAQVSRPAGGGGVGAVCVADDEPARRQGERTGHGTFLAIAVPEDALDATPRQVEVDARRPPLHRQR